MAKVTGQRNYHRAEHWIDVAGVAQLTKAEIIFLWLQNESLHIPIGVTHRLENTETSPIAIIEIQSVSYLGEDDVVRFEGRYGLGSKGSLLRQKHVAIDLY